MKISQILSIALVAFALIACDNKAKDTAETLKAAPPAEKASVVTEVKNENPNTTKTDEAKTDEKLAKFEFVETQYDFGDINQGDVVEHTFKFKNVGEAPLVITDTKVTCGCTTPSFTREPVAPGEDGEIQVKFNSAGKSGKVAKTVTIMANVEGGRSLIRINTNINTGTQAGPYKQ